MWTAHDFYVLAVWQVDTEIDDPEQMNGARLYRLCTLLHLPKRSLIRQVAASKLRTGQWRTHMHPPTRRT